MGESVKEKKARAAEIIHRLKAAYPNSKCSLSYSTTHELLVATILSAQCTDRRVNQVTRQLFEKYRSPEDYAYADVNDLARDIHSCGYHNQKARSIVGASLKIVEEFGGKVPGTMEELVSLPGVGRKTANCVLGECFGVPAMVIDTHMIRIMNLLGLTDSRNPNQIERQLKQIFDPDDWVGLTHMIIDHGRSVCVARRPVCGECVLSDLCPSSGKR
ncbi:MAG: endonuclease III [FCB group bacterium]|nr:endonuclease III [FCB group bacterium]